MINRSSVATHFGTPPIDVADFDNWVAILAKVDQSDDVEYARDKYRSFLSRYPNCYGFWQKYAEYEKKMGNVAEAKAVWEKGIINIPLSIDLWLGYTADVKNIKNFPPESLRDLYARAIDIAGLEYQSDRLWLEAIGFERAVYIDELCKGSTTANCRRIGVLFDRLLSTPTFHAPSHLDRFIQYLNTIEPHVLLSDREYQEIMKLVCRQLDKTQEELVQPVQLSYICAAGENGMLNIVTEPAEGTFNIQVNSMQHDPTALQLIRTEVVARRNRIFERNMKECEMRAGFEANIKRPYFHVKPLDYPQLFNWMAYLDFETKQGDEDRIKILYDRCLIPCSLYEEFWIKCARWTWKNFKSKSKTREVYMKAKIHCPTSVNLALSHSGFEEIIDNYDDAIKILDNFRNEYPGYLLLEIRYLGTLRRASEANNETIKPDFLLNQYEALIKDSQASPNLHSFYSIKLARYHQKSRRDPRLAQKIIKKALTIDPFNLQLYSQYVDIAYSSDSMTEVDVIQAFDVALDSTLRLEDKVRFSQRKLDFLEELGNNVNAIEDHRDYHYNLLGQLPDNATIRTRFVNDPSRVYRTLMPPMAPQQPMVYSPQLPQPPMNMVPMMQMQQPPPMQFVNQAPPPVQLTLIEPTVTSSTI